MPRLRHPETVPDVERKAVDTDGVVPLATLHDAGVTRGQRAAQIVARRWVPIPRRGIITTTGAVSGDAAIRLALLQVGPAAAVGGVSALQLAGMTGFDEDHLHIWVPKSAFKAKPVDVALHETRRWVEDDVLVTGIRRSRSEIATIQAALWATSRRQSALLLIMPVQQRLVRAADLVDPLERVRRHEFRSMLRGVLADVLGGVQSLNELDFARLCRAHGLPEPTRQVRRTSPQGRIYLDVHWDGYGVSLEVNGAGHGILTQAMSDEIRAMDIQVEGDAAVQVSSVTIRVDPKPFVEALGRLLRSRGWSG